MSKNVWDLDLDIKFRYSASIPIFRRKDSAVLNMYLFDAKVRKDISNFTRASISIKYPSGTIIDVEALRQGSGMNTYISYEFPESISLEVGVYDLILTVEKDGGFISTPKFHVAIFDNISQAEYEFVKMIQDMQLQIDYLETLLGNIVPKTSIAQANGLVPLDSQGKIPMAHMPLFLEEHINTNVYLQMVHGFMVDKDRYLVYETNDGSLEYVGHPDNSGLNNKLNLSTIVKDSIVTLYYSGRGNATQQKWMAGNKSLNDMKTSGTSFTGLTFKVSQTGIHTIYYVDNFKNEYLYKFSVDITQIKEPVVNIDVDGGKVIVDTDTELEVIKIGEGRQTIEWFQTNGTVISNSYRITKAGEYTIYYKDKLGREYIKYITVTEDMLETEDADPPVIKFTETPVGYAKDKKVVEISIADASPIIDKRYKTIPYSGSERPKQSDFELNPSYGTKMASNTIKITLTENSVLYVYAQDQHGNKTFTIYYMSNIDKDAPTMEAYDYWDATKNKYIINYKFVDANSGLDKITLPDSSIAPLPYPQARSLEGSFETNVFGDKKFIATDMVGNTKTYTYKMKGKPMRAFAQDSTLYIIREDGYLYSAGGNTSSLLGIGEDASGLTWQNKFRKVLTDTKFSHQMTTAGEATVLVDTTGKMWQLGNRRDIVYNRENNITGIAKVVERFTDIEKVTEVSPNLSSGSGVTAVKSNGQWIGAGGGFGTFGDGTENIYKTFQPVGKAMPVPFNRFLSILDNSFFFGIDGKVYASGWNNNGLQAGFTPTSSYQIYATPQECNLINPHGAVKDITAIAGMSLRWWIFNNKILRSGDSRTGQIKEFTGMPPSADYIKSTNAREALMIVYKNGIYVTGWNNEGQLGLGNKTSVPDSDLVKVPFNKNVIDGVISSYAGLIIDDGYTIHMTGENLNSNSYIDATSYLQEYEVIK